jgi:hypothetical protein
MVAVVEGSKHGVQDSELLCFRDFPIVLFSKNSNFNHFGREIKERHCAMVFALPSFTANYMPRL